MLDSPQRHVVFADSLDAALRAQNEGAEILAGGTWTMRAEIAANRVEWARADPEAVARQFRSGEIDMLDVIRRHAVILHWGTGELLPESTRQFRESFERRSVAKWAVA